MSQYDKWIDALDGIIMEVLNGTVHTSIVVEAIKRDSKLSEFQVEALVDYLMKRV